MRITSDWISSFLKRTEHLPSPPIFRKWAAISAIAGTLERRAWIKSMNMEIYPNLYVILCGPPGVGKTVITSVTEELWRSIPGFHVAPKSLSKASLIDSLADAKRTKTSVNGINTIHMEYNSLLINAGELGVLIPQYDPDFMNILTDIYDGRVYEERRRGKDLHILIKKPQLNILGATTPSYLNGTLPEGAWDQGFLSRTFLIFSGETALVDIFGDDDLADSHYDDLKSDIREIAGLMGAFTFDPEPRTAIREWHLRGGEPKPTHPKLVHYNTRRSAHLLKLCMVSSASRSSDLKITLEDYHRALGWLLEAEAIMPDIFKALGASSDGKVIEEAYHYLFKVFMANKEPIAEHRLVNFLSERVPAYNVLRIIDIMERAGQIEKSLTNAGLPAWRPKPKMV